jgi:hypothetical protein
MPGPGWLFRLAIAALFLVIVLVAVGLGWANPGPFFYVATSVVGLLVWIDYEFNRRAPPPEEHAKAIETTAPEIRKGDGPAP